MNILYKVHRAGVAGEGLKSIIMSIAASGRIVYRIAEKCVHFVSIGFTPER